MKSIRLSIALVFLNLSFIACIGDDYIDDEVDPVIVISNPISKIQIGNGHQFEYNYFNNIGQNEIITDAVWLSSNEGIISINSLGLAGALELGISTIRIERTGDLTIFDEVEVEVTEMPVDNPDITKNGTIKTTSSYTLEGTFKINVEGNGIKIEFENDYKASTSLPGLYVYLSNNPNTIADANEIGAVTVFSGAHNYIVEDVGINDFQYLLYFCKPFNVKVGDGQIN